MTTAQKIYAKAMAARADDGRCYLDAADVSKLVKAMLAGEFPGVAFSTRLSRYSGGDSVHISWIDGPTTAEVEAISGRYSFGGFDGSIDLAYSVENWLNPDGTMSIAHTTGTEGSMGSHPEVIGSPKHPGAVLVYGGTDYVFTSRRLSTAKQLECAEIVAKQAAQFGPVADAGESFGPFTVDKWGNVEDQRLPSMADVHPTQGWLTRMVWHVSEGRDIFGTKKEESVFTV